MKQEMKLAGVLVALMLFASVLVPVMAAGPISPANWDIAGTWALMFTLLPGGSTWPHTMTVITFDLTTGGFTGTGFYDRDHLYTWIVTGIVIGDDVTFHILYTGKNPGYAVDAAGSIAPCGYMMGGTATGPGQSFTWTGTGTALALGSFGVFTNAGCVPAGSSLVLNIVHSVTNDEDSGNVGYWALDNYNKHVQVWQLPDGTYYVIARYVGKWQTFAGALSPGAGVIQSRDASGAFEGGYTATFTATSFTSAFGNIGTYDYGGTKKDVLLGTYGAGQTGPTPSFSYLSTYFTGASGFTYLNWGWTYHYRGQTWLNYASGTTGDIVA